jgi:hypothetical protein
MNLSAKKTRIGLANNVPLQWLLGIGGLLMIVYLVGKSAGKRTVENYVAKDLPNSGSGIPQGWKGTAVDVVDRLHKLLTSWWDDSISMKENYFRILYAYTDDQLTYCYNIWNSKYGVKDRKTMTQTIDDEWLVLPDWSGGVRNKLVYRLKGLKLN